MPPARKSCGRCREQKTRCIWSGDSGACVRCLRMNFACLAPTNDTKASCERCRRLKTKCEWSGDSAECVRCQQMNLVCLDPALTTSEPDKASAANQLPPENGHGRHNGQGAVTHWYSKNEAFEMPLPLAQRVPTPDPYDSSRYLNGIKENTMPVFVTNNPAAEKPFPFVIGSCNKGNCWLPQPEVGHILFQEYLHDFNSRLPLFNPENLYANFRDCYAGVNDSKPLPWVLLYVTMAISHRLRAISLFASPEDTPQAEWYLDKALSKLPELLMGPPALPLIQASLGMAFVLETSNRYERAALFASTALHMAHQLGYNEISPEQLATSALSREQAYVFWIAFCMDTHMSLANQKPSSQRLADISTPVPTKDVLDWWKPDGNNAAPFEWNLNIFAQHCSLAIVEAEAAEELFSAKARKRSVTENIEIYDGIVSKLESWRESNALSKLGARDVLKAMYRSDIVHSVNLEASYFRAIYQLHATRTLVKFTTKLDVYEPEALRAMFDLHSAPCYTEAQRFLYLVKLLPQGNFSTTWASMQAIVSAICTVLTAQAGGNGELLDYRISDLHICQTVLVALEDVAQAEIESSFRAAIELCRDLYVQTEAT